LFFSGAAESIEISYTQAFRRAAEKQKGLG
jgi:hypothetical protein